MKILKPSDVVNFGKNKGFLLKDIYKYEPDYLEWLVKFIDDFVIDLKSFEKLPNPTPLKNHLDNKEDLNQKTNSYKIKFFNHNDITVENAKITTKNGEELNEIKFKFSQETKTIIDLKLNGKYKAPEYKNFVNQMNKIEWDD